MTGGVGTRIPGLKRKKKRQGETRVLVSQSKQHVSREIASFLITDIVGRWCRLRRPERATGSLSEKRRDQSMWYSRRTSPQTGYDSSPARFHLKVHAGRRCLSRLYAVDRWSIRTLTCTWHISRRLYSAPGPRRIHCKAEGKPRHILFRRVEIKTISRTNPSLLLPRPSSHVPRLLLRLILLLVDLRQLLHLLQYTRLQIAHPILPSQNLRHPSLNLLVSFCLSSVNIIPDSSSDPVAEILYIANIIPFHEQSCPGHKDRKDRKSSQTESFGCIEAAFNFGRYVGGSERGERELGFRGARSGGGRNGSLDHLRVGSNVFSREGTACYEGAEEGEGEAAVEERILAELTGGR